MTTYYIRKTGSDAALGTSPGAAWLTIGKALGAAGIASGDTVYVGAGTYREAVTVAMTSATVETRVVADTDGSHTGDAGDVIWTAYTTSDTTAAAASTLVTLAARDFLTFENFVLVGGNTATTCVGAGSTNSTNITFLRCLFIPGVAAGTNVVYTGTANAAANWTIDSCIMVIAGSGGSGLNLTLPTSASADYDVNFQVKNCLFLSGAGVNAIYLTTSGALSFKAGGVDIFNSTFLGAGSAVITATANFSTSIPCTVYNCIVALANNGLNANGAGHIVEDYNILDCQVPRTNVSTGTNSKGGATYAYSLLLEFGQSFFQGRTPRQLGMPLLASPALGFGNQAGNPTTDFAGVPRPSGPGVTWANALNAVGYLERGNTASREVTTVRTGSNALKLLGPATQDFDVPVNATSTTISVWGRYDGTYAGTLPQMSIVNGEECGVATATDTMVGAADTWEELSLTIVPTAAGIVTVRLRSSSTAGGGACFFDDFNVA